MQSHDWNDLKYLLTLHRAGKLQKAGRIVGVSDTTVARRIRALEQKLGASLFLRSATGRYEPTDATLEILKHAEAIETAHNAIAATTTERTSRVVGSVRISSVPIIVNRLLVPKLGTLTRMHPDLTIELVPASDNLDLSKREADLALRFARPTGGGMRIKAQKLGEMKFGVYAARSIEPEHRARWIRYDDAHSGLPQARWIDDAAGRSSEPNANLKVADAETAIEGVANGLGKSLLPCEIADADPRLQAIASCDEGELPTREIWLLAHTDQASRSSISAAKDWLKGLVWH